MSDKMNDGGPAFGHGTMPDPNDPMRVVPVPQLTVRDWFAGQALAGLLAAKSVLVDDNWNRLQGPPYDARVADIAYSVADAMLAERERQP